MLEEGTSAERISTSLLEGGEGFQEWDLNARLKSLGRTKARPWLSVVRVNERRSGRACVRLVSEPVKLG